MAHHLGWRVQNLENPIFTSGFLSATKIHGDCTELTAIVCEHLPVCLQNPFSQEAVCCIRHPVKLLSFILGISVIYWRWFSNFYIWNIIYNRYVSSYAYLKPFSIYLWRIWSATMLDNSMGINWGNSNSFESPFNFLFWWFMQQKIIIWC